jgi:hypothetical protein
VQPAGATAARPVDYIVSFRVDDSEVASQEAAIASAQSARGGAAPHAAKALRARAHARARTAVKERVLAAGGAAAQGGARLARDFNHLSVSVVSVASPEALEALRSDPSVLSVEAPQVYGLQSLSAQGTPLSVEHGRRGRRLLVAESLPLIDQPAAAAAGYTGEGCNVAVLDTGARGGGRGLALRASTSPWRTGLAVMLRGAHAPAR